jgi:hypothetical protein
MSRQKRQWTSRTAECPMHPHLLGVYPLLHGGTTLVCVVALREAASARLKSALSGLTLTGPHIPCLLVTHTFKFSAHYPLPTLQQHYIMGVIEKVRHLSCRPVPVSHLPRRSKRSRVNFACPLPCPYYSMFIYQTMVGPQRRWRGVRV